mgnify:CR=1 FL=1
MGLGARHGILTHEWRAVPNLLPHFSAFSIVSSVRLYAPPTTDHVSKEECYNVSCLLTQSSPKIEHDVSMVYKEKCCQKIIFMWKGVFSFAGE